MLILIRDVQEIPAGKEVKPYPLSKLSATLKVPVFVLKSFVRDGTLVEIAIQAGPVDSLKYYRVQHQE